MIRLIKERSCKANAMRHASIAEPKPTFAGYIRQIVFAWKFKRAVKKADKLSRLFGMKYLVIFLNGGLKVVPKQTVRELVRKHRFRKGVTVADIEKRALYVTQ